MNPSYVHGYNPRENIRLQDQASTLADLLLSDTIYLAGSTVLEAGCGVGAQTITLVKNSPEALFTCVDISDISMEHARHKIQTAGYTNATFQQGDILHLPFSDKSFDHVFVCFVLEHLHNPMEALYALKRLIKPGGTITVIEGDHGSTYFHPESDYANKAIHCQVELQKRGGGNALIGRQLYPLIMQAGYKNCHVSPRMVYVDSSKPYLVEGFTKNTFIAMIEGVREQTLAAELLKADVFDRGIRDLYRTTEDDGVFCYTFFKAVAFI